MTSLTRACARIRRGIAAGVLLLLCVLAIAIAGTVTGERRHSLMTMAERVRENLIPAIEAMSPADTQTATFALG